MILKYKKIKRFRFESLESEKLVRFNATLGCFWSVRCFNKCYIKESQREREREWEKNMMKKYKNVEKNARVKMFLTACPSPPLFLSLIKSQGYSSKLKFITREIAVFRCRYTSAVVEAAAVDW